MRGYEVGRVPSLAVIVLAVALLQLDGVVDLLVDAVLAGLSVDGNRDVVFHAADHLLFAIRDVLPGEGEVLKLVGVAQGDEEIADVSVVVMQTVHRTANFLFFLYRQSRSGKGL